MTITMETSASVLFVGKESLFHLMQEVRQEGGGKPDPHLGWIHSVTAAPTGPCYVKPVSWSVSVYQTPAFRRLRVQRGKCHAMTALSPSI